MRDLARSKKPVIAIFAAILLALTLAGCDAFDREPITAYEFIVVAESLSFEVRERQADELSFSEDEVLRSFEAAHGAATVIFDVYIDDGRAIRVFNDYNREVENFIGSPTSQWTTTMPSVNQHTRRASNIFATATRVDNTVLFATAVGAEDVAAVDTLIYIIGY